MVENKNFLVKVLGYSALPRVVTACLTFVCFPIMLRSLGAEEYGVVIYMGAIVALFESFVDLGVSSAAGKSIAKYRDSHPEALGAIVLKWSRFQFFVALVGLLPLLAIIYFVSRFSNSAASYSILLILSLTTWVAIILNFARLCLTSLLAFNYMAILDTSESIVRSLCWVIVAFLFPTSYGLAVGLLITAVLASLLAVILIVAILKRKYKLGSSRKIFQNLVYNNKEFSKEFRVKTMIFESFNFLFLKLITRTFQSTSIILFGKFVGAELVGIVGGFTKISEILNFPFNILGNALAARSHAIKQNGKLAVVNLWDMCLKIISFSIVFFSCLYLGADILAKFLLPNTLNVGGYFELLSFSIIANAISYTITPISDYIGALKIRNIFMVFSIMFQSIFIWLGAKKFGAEGAIVGYLVVLFLMNCGYFYIALRAFEIHKNYKVRREVIKFGLISVITLFLVYFIIHSSYIRSFLGKPSIALGVGLFLYLVIILIYLIIDKQLRKYYLSKTFFSLD